MQRWHWCLLVAVAVMMLGAPAAGAQDVSREPTAQLRFVHGVTGAPEVDLYLDDTLIVAGLPPAQATRYGLIGAGSHVVRAYPAKSDPGQRAPLVEEKIELGTGLSYTLALAGSASGIEAWRFEDQTGRSEGSQGSVRVIHLAPDQPPVALTRGEAALSGVVAYGEASERLFLDPTVESATFTLISQRGEMLLTTPVIPYESGEFYTLFVLPSASGVRELLVSYPLTAGEPPRAQVWLPLSVSGSTGGIVAPTTAMPATTAATAPTAPLLPATGQREEGSDLPLWLMGAGLLLVMGAAGAGWIARRAGG